MKIDTRAASTRRRIIPITVALLLAAAALIFWRPLVGWFTGAPVGGGESRSGRAAGTEVRTGTGTAAGTMPTGPEAPALPAAELPAAALSALQNAFTAYEDVRARLAADRLEGLAAPAKMAAEQIRAASRALSGLRSDVKDSMDRGAAAADRLATATSLEQTRQEFGELSRFLVALAGSDARLQTGWHVFRCPMATGFDKWFQRAPALENPYMGQAMPACGSKTDWQPAAPAAPPESGVSHDGHGHGGDDVAFYTCSMHPSVEKKEPGTCPICSMNLSPVTYDETEGGEVRIDEARRQLIGLGTSKVTRAPLSVPIRAIGRLTYDETRLRDVSLKVQGWISRLRVSATGQPVKRGEVLFTLYSPELFAAQAEYILALASQKTASAGGRSDYLVKAAEKKLRLWDVTPAQLATIAKRGEPVEELPILAPASGYVIEKDVVEGGAVEPGKRLYRIAALDKVWIEAQIYELDLGGVKKGQKARVSLPYREGEALEGTVAYVYPYLDPSSRTGRIRIELANRDLAFKPDMYANVELQVDLGPRLQVPVESVVYTGPRRLVFLDLGEGRIRPQEVTLGARNGERVEVTSGLVEGQTIVSSANFLVAAESRIRSAARFWSDEPDPEPGAPAGPGAPEGKESGHAGH